MGTDTRQIDRLTVPSPIGPLTLLAEDGYLIAIVFPGEEPSGHGIANDTLRDAPDSPVLRQTADQLAEYFEGERTEFDVPIRLDGTEFQ
ncbi:MAG: methylated-DNA--[protein]-cysteine S-methyltransferase, partial [Actinomycetia bacterium]|nr:methylated-DNA--[protein]-cysteine S-methyltransferase [Actinomycetes bacterium]